jgi:hypothetical protein
LVEMNWQKQQPVVLGQNVMYQKERQ